MRNDLQSISVSDVSNPKTQELPEAKTIKGETMNMCRLGGVRGFRIVVLEGCGDRNTTHQFSHLRLRTNMVPK